MQYLLDIKKTQLQMMIDRGFPIGDEEAILNMRVPEFTEYLIRLRGDTRRSFRFLLSRFYVKETGQAQPAQPAQPNRTVLVYYADKTIDRNKFYTRSRKGETKEGVARRKHKNIETGENIKQLEELRIKQSGKRKETVLTVAIQPYIALIQEHIPDLAILIGAARLSKQADRFITDNLIRFRTRRQFFHELELAYNPTYHVDVPRHELLSPEEAQAKLREMKTSAAYIPLMKSNDPIAKYYGWIAGNLIRIHRDDQVVSILSPKSINYRILVD